MVPIENLRQARVIEGHLANLESDHIAYLGLFNATDYLGTINGWLESQARRDIPLIVCDNKSTDETWSLAREQITKSYSKVVFVQTPINLGGYGAFSLNFDLFKHSEWITTFHQDDRYGANHLSAHAEHASIAVPNLGIIASEQESYSTTGFTLGYPRVHWLLPIAPEPTSVFLANLKRHSLPFSGASFRRQLLEEIKIPWHSTAFPDTELVLRMLPHWSGLVDSSSVVRYRENPHSESHSIDNAERDLGAVMSLSRVFASRNFSQLCSQVPGSKQESFVFEVVSALSHRVKHLAYREYITTLALEVLFQEFGPLPIITKKLESTYYSVGADAATALLHNLHTFPGGDSAEICLHNKKVEPQKEINNLVAQRVQKFLYTSLAIFLGLLPTKPRKSLIRMILRLAKVFRIRTSWNFDY